jgi:hypothetical protein
MHSLPPINSHIHLPPNFSAFDTVQQAVRLAHEQGLRALGVSNYYHFSVYRQFAAEAEAVGIVPLYGLEIIALLHDLQSEGIKLNDPGNPGKMYICGKGIVHFNPMRETAAALLQTVRDNDTARMDAVCSRMAQLFADAGLETGLDTETVRRLVVSRHGSPLDTVTLQERHIAQAFQQRLFELLPAERRAPYLTQLYGTQPKADPEDPVGVQNELRSNLMKAGRPAYVDETFVDFSHACRLILALGGIPCYPVLADGASPVCSFEEDPKMLVDALLSRGIHFAEVIPIRNRGEVLARYVHALRDAGIPVTAGTEHNTLEMLPLQPLCLHGEPIDEPLRRIFWEGMCVALGHQSEVTAGRDGYVLADGTPNPKFRSTEARISAYAEIGSQLLRQQPPATPERSPCP